MYQLKLHGIRHQAFARNISQDDDDPLEQMATAAAAIAERRSSISSSSSVPSTASSSGPPRKSSEALWKRRHSLAAASKNTDWSDFYLSVAANDSNMAGFLSIKDDADVDAEYFCSYIPKAVIHRDLLYKQLLALYNALHYWGERGLIKNKHLLVALYDPEAADLIKTAKVRGKLGPDKVLMIKTINDYCSKMGIETRVPELECKLEDTVVYCLLHTANPSYRNKFKEMMVKQSKNKGASFHAKDKLFPPVYV